MSDKLTPEELAAPLYEEVVDTLIPLDVANEKYQDLVDKRKSAQKATAQTANELLYALARRIERDPAGATPYEGALFIKHGRKVPVPFPEPKQEDGLCEGRR